MTVFRDLGAELGGGVQCCADDMGLVHYFVFVVRCPGPRIRLAAIAKTPTALLTYERIVAQRKSTIHQSLNGVYNAT